MWFFLQRHDNLRYKKDQSSYDPSLLHDSYSFHYLSPFNGGGIEIKMGRNQNFMEVALLIPFRPKEFDDDLQNIRSQGIDITEPLPFAVSFGYHFKF